MGRAKVIPFPKDPLLSAKAAGLRYVRDHEPGIRRVKSGKAFRYVKPDGSPVRDEPTLRRIRSLVIPPAWTDVWICATDDGHLQAVGRDARGRKQYRYHASYRRQRDQTVAKHRRRDQNQIGGEDNYVIYAVAFPGIFKNEIGKAIISERFFAVKYRETKD